MADSVKSWLSKGDFSFANPSSSHLLGQRSSRIISEVKDYLFHYFQLSERDFKIIFHSGASEGISTFIPGIFQRAFEKKKVGHYIFSKADHAAVQSQAKRLEQWQVPCSHLKINVKGELYPEQGISCGDGLTHLLNFTWVNNETGVVWDLTEAFKLKEKFSCIVHVDAAQSIGKIYNATPLDPRLDIYTFSCHKFGALKGVGFSFVKKEIDFAPLITGGDQQKGDRSGTENVMGVMSIKLALEELSSKQNLKELELARTLLEERLLADFRGKVEIIGLEASARSLNTSFLRLKNCKIETVLMALDMEGLFLSTGPACSSGQLAPSKALMAMGFEERCAKSTLRISLPFSAERGLVDEFYSALQRVLQAHLK